ncbi:unnamed protein product [Ascophyllum nodosum]
MRAHQLLPLLLALVRSGSLNFASPGPRAFQSGNQKYGEKGSPLSVRGTAAARSHAKDDWYHLGQTSVRAQGLETHESSPMEYGDGDTSLRFTCSNEYPAITQTKWTHYLAEPYKETILTASSKIGDPTNDVFIWRFWDDKNTVLEGREVTHTFETVGRQRVTLSQIVVATGTAHYLEAHVMVKYVRREFRQLTDKDREAFLNALEAIYRLPTHRGRTIYGEDYRGIEYFVQMHLDGAGVKECDHWHDDAGIMTHHVGFTLLFEQGLQVIDPSVSIPYWSYTIESALEYDSYGESELFVPGWFGDASPDNSLHTVDNGRFAYLPVFKKAAEYGYIHNAYGLLRTPWNLDSTPFVTRHNETNGQSKTDMVSCEIYSSSFDSSTLKVFNSYLNGGTHGPVHIILGGQWNDPEELFLQSADFSQLAVLITKFLWRKGYLRLPVTCNEEVDGAGDVSTCRASCPAELYESRGMTPYDVLVDTHALYWASKGNRVIRYDSDEDRFYVMGHEDDEDFQTAFWAKMLRSLCDPGHVGEMFTSAAPYDPTFWVIHPEAERYLSWRRILGREGFDGYEFDETWGYRHDGGPAGDSGTMCDWSDVRPDTLDMPSCVKMTCGGHYATDTLPFEIKIKGEVRKMTNLEWLEFIYPDTEDLPYVYNEYNWDHCTDVGYSIGPTTTAR